MENNDILYQAAKIFEEIKSYKIEITIGRKGQAEVFTIIFEDSDFHHLAGLHKLTDIVQVYKQNASIVFSKILEREICLSDLEASSFYTLIQDRISILLSLKNLFFNINSVFKFRKLMIPNSKIRWTYLLEFTYNTTDSGYLFWKNIEQSLLIMYVFQISRKMLTMDQDKSSTHYSKQKQ